MTLMELQDVLGERITMAQNSANLDDAERKKQMEDSDMIARLAKQMINNADVVLRADKLLSGGNLDKESSISKLVK